MKNVRAKWLKWWILTATEIKIGKHWRPASSCVQVPDLSETIRFLISHLYAAIVVADATVTDFCRYSNY